MCSHTLCIREALSSVFSKYNLHIVHVPINKLENHLVNVKNRLPRVSFSRVANKMPFADYGQVYNGETGKFSRNPRKHKHDVTNNSHTTSGIADDVHEHNHVTDWDNAAVITK